MMYTSGNGERRIRVINFRYLTSSKLENVYESVDYLAVANVIIPLSKILSRIYSSKLYNGDPSKVREEFLNKIANIIAEYKFKCSSIQPKYSELSAPPNLRLALPYIHTIINSKLFTNPLKLTNDYRIAEILRINSTDFYSFAMRYYPKLYPLTLDIYDTDPLPGDFIELESVNQ